MKNKQTIKKVLIGLVIAIAILVAYSMFNGGSKDSISSGGLSSLIGSSSTGQIDETETMVANAEILKILGSIEHIELHDDIFTNPIFRKLKDTNFAIPRPSRIGRKNPFLPIGFDTLVNLGQTQDEVVSQDQSEEDNEGFFLELGENLN